MRLRLAVAATAAVAVVLGSPARAAENPFVGTWKLDATSSQLAGDTMTFAAQRHGKIRFTAAGQSYTFKPDGKTYEGPMRQKVTWTQVDGQTWRAAWKLKKKVVATETLAVAPDGRTLTDTVQGTRADGTPFEDAVTYERTGGAGASLMGAWRSTRVALGGFQTLAIAPHGKNGIVFTMVDFGSSCTARLDGEDHAFKGPTTPPGLTFSFLPRGERALHVVQKQDGIPLYIGTLTLDADGRTLTWDWTPTQVKEPLRAVFVRQ